MGSLAAALMFIPATHVHIDPPTPPSAACYRGYVWQMFPFQVSLLLGWSEAAPGSSIITECLVRGEE